MRITNHFNDDEDNDADNNYDYGEEVHRFSHFFQIEMHEKKMCVILITFILLFNKVKQ